MTMTWNHRVTRDRQDDGTYWYAIREVHYDKRGNVELWTEKPIAVEGETLDEVSEVLGQMVASLTRGVFDLETRETLP